MTKYMTKTTLIMTVVAFVLSIGFAAQAAHKRALADPEPRGVMANHYASNPTNLSDVKEKWGNPIDVHTFDNGIAKHTFGPYDPEVGYTVILSKNGMVVDKRFTGSILNLKQLRNDRRD